MSKLDSWIQENESCVDIFLQVQPGAKKTVIVGVLGDRLKVRIHAPPTDGKANLELLDFFVEYLAVRRSQVTLKSGFTSRLKTIRIEGTNKEHVLKKIQP